MGIEMSRQEVPCGAAAAGKQGGVLSWLGQWPMVSGGPPLPCPPVVGGLRTGSEISICAAKRQQEGKKFFRGADASRQVHAQLLFWEGKSFAVTRFVSLFFFLSLRTCSFSMNSRAGEEGRGGKKAVGPCLVGQGGEGLRWQQTAAGQVALQADGRGPCLSHAPFASPHAPSGRRSNKKWFRARSHRAPILPHADLETRTAAAVDPWPRARKRERRGMVAPPWLRLPSRGAAQPGVLPNGGGRRAYRLAGTQTGRTGLHWTALHCVARRAQCRSLGLRVWGARGPKGLVKARLCSCEGQAVQRSAGHSRAGQRKAAQVRRRAFGREEKGWLVATLERPRFALARVLVDSLFGGFKLWRTGPLPLATALAPATR